MSEDKLEMARRALTEFTRTLRATNDFADDFVWDFSAFEGWIEAPELHGREAFDEQMDRWTEPFESWTMEISQMLDAGGDDVLGLGVQRGVLTGGGTIEMPIAQIWTWRDGKVQRVRMFLRPEDAYAAAGLTPPESTGQSQRVGSA